MKFFTDKTVINDYLLIKIKDYWKLQRKGNDFSRWKEVFIDPGVYELTKALEYSWVNKMSYNMMGQWIKNLPNNHYFSWDYPGDMNVPHQDYFMDKSWQNAKEYCKYPQYVITVQSKFKDYEDFVKWFDKYNKLEIKSGIVGLGNMCRFRNLNDYLKNALDYAFSKCKHPRIHIYGLCLRAIPYAVALSKRYNVKLSIDSTKWTRAVNKKLKDKYNGRVCCRKENRQEFFDEYKKRIKEVLLENEKK